VTVVELWTDGACSGNPGPGGWAAILRHGDAERELSGREAPTTNNRMELLAAISGLEALTRPCEVVVFADSAYMVNAVAKGWLERWRRNGWQTGSGARTAPVKNQDLWERMLVQLARHTVRFEKVKGHANVRLNERCDRIARSAAASRG
jgi:ribonuclease HI